MIKLWQMGGGVFVLACVAVSGGCLRSKDQTLVAHASSAQSGSSSASSPSGSGTSSVSEQPAKRNPGVFGVKDRAKVTGQFHNLGLAYIQACANEPPMPPKKVEDIQTSLDGETVNLIKDEYYVVYFGVDLNKVVNPSETILAYENATVAGGRYVLLADGRVRRMDEKEFAAAPRAKK